MAVAARAQRRANSTAPVERRGALKFPTVLPRQLKLRSASELWRQKKPPQPLFCLEPTSVISRRFSAGLRQHQLEAWKHWTASSIESVEMGVQKHGGLGVSVAMPGRKLPAGLRALSLPNFPAVDVGVLWRQPLSPAIISVIEQLENETKRFRPRASGQVQGQGMARSAS